MAGERMLIDRSTLEDIGNAIRAKKGTTALIPVPNLASEILSIEGGGTTVGEWSPETTAYNIGDIVTYNGVYYICIKALSIGAVMSNPEADTDSWERINGEVVEGNDTCTMEYTSGSEPIGIVYSNGIETKNWANTPVGERITVACNTPIVFYYPMGDDAPSVTLTAANGTTIEPYYSSNTKRIYSIPSEYKNTHISISW